MAGDSAARRAAAAGRLREALRSSRRRSGPPTLEEVEEEVDLLRRAERSLERWEAALHEAPPDEQAAKDFEADLHLYWQPITALGSNLSTLGEADPLPDGWEQAVRGLLDVVQGYQDLLLSFEHLLHGLPPPAPTALVESFEDLLNEAQTVLARLYLVIARSPTTAAVRRYARRVRTDGELVASLETLVKQQALPTRALAASLLGLVGRHQSRLWELLQVVEKTPDNRPLLTALENAMHAEHALAESAADVIDDYLPDARLAVDYEELVASLERAQDHFEGVVKSRTPPDRFLIRSFENLLRELGHVLARLSRMVEAGPDHPQLKALGRRLDVYAGLLQSFQTVVAGATREEFVRSLLDLLERFVRLLDRFAQLVAADPGDDDQKKESKDLLAGLRRRLKELVASLEELKAKLPSLPEDLHEGDQRLLAAMQALDEGFLALLGSEPQPGELHEHLGSLAAGGRLLSRSGSLLRRGTRRPPAAAVVEGHAALVDAQARLVAAARDVVATMPSPTVHLTDALEDLDALQATLRPPT